MSSETEAKAHLAIMLQKFPAPWRMGYFGSGDRRGAVIKAANSKEVMVRVGHCDGLQPDKDTMRGLVALVNSIGGSNV